MSKIFFTVAMMLGALLMAGCVAIQPLPIAARGGDTITLALGSQEGMTTTNTTATFTPDSTGVPVALTPKSIFNLYPDKRSKLYGGDTSAGTLVTGTSHEQWVTVMVTDLPQGLPVGFGKIKVSTTVTQADAPNAKIETVDIQLEILAGTGQAHPLQYLTSSSSVALTGNLKQLQRISSQVYVTPPAIGGCTDGYSAIEMRFQLPFVVEPARDISLFRVVADDFSVQTSEKPADLIWSAKSNELKVVFMNDDNVLRCYEARFSIIPRAGTVFNRAPTLLSVTYYDSNGQAVTGPGISSYQVLVR